MDSILEMKLDQLTQPFLVHSTALKRGDNGGQYSGKHDNLLLFRDSEIRACNSSFLQPAEASRGLPSLLQFEVPNLKR
jgi:hypothetical protein